jgi:hypothetical protein
MPDTPVPLWAPKAAAPRVEAADRWDAPVPAADIPEPPFAAAEEPVDPDLPRRLAQPCRNPDIPNTAVVLRARISGKSK